MPKQHFFIEGRYLGSIDRTQPLDPDRRHLRPLSVLLYCDQCGDPWARFPIEYSDKRIAPWQAYASTCRKHQGLGYANRIPGSVMFGYDSDFIASLPLSVLLWEFQRELDFYDRSLQNGES